MRDLIRLTPRRIVLGLLAGSLGLWAIGQTTAGRSPYASTLLKEKPPPGTRVLRHK